MVHLMLSPAKLEPSEAAVSALLGVGQRAQERLPNEEAPLAEKLFALECAARAGSAASPTVEQYRPTLRDVDWWLNDHWEADVPHVVVLAQAFSATSSLDLAAPAIWREKLEEGLDALAPRHTKFGIDNDPALLAAVLRGMAAADMEAPGWLMDAADKSLDEYAPVEAAAELTEALCRHSAPGPLVAKAVSAAFSGADASDHDGAYARWWLYGRTPAISKHVPPAAIQDARLQAIAAAQPFEAKAAAMLTEVALREAGQLIIGTPGEIAGARSSADTYMLVTRALYRALFFAALILAVLLDLHNIARAVAPKGSVGPYEHLIVAASFALLSYCITGTAEACYRATGHDAPRWTRRFETVVALIAGIIGAWTA
jgi:hypothetical protein